MIRMRSRIRFATAALVVACFGVAPAFAAEEKIPAAAQEAMDAGQAAFRADDLAAAVEHYRKAADLAPRNLEVQQMFILNHRYVNLTTLSKEEAEKRFETLREHYRDMAEREPENALWQVLLGAVQFYEDPHASLRAYERAVELDPGQVEALQMLGVLATTRGENDLARSYYERAAAAAPDDPSAVGMLVGAVRDEGYEPFRVAVMDLVSRFPESGEAVKWYYWLGADAPSPAEQRRVWTEAIERYPVASASDEQMGWLGSIYRMVFQSLQDDDPFEAERFARMAVGQFEGKDAAKQWFESYRRQAELSVALLAADVGEHEAALEILTDLHEALPARDPLREPILYRMALAQTATGNPTSAVDALLDALKDGPRPILEAAYYDAAEKAGIPRERAEERVWEARLADAKPFADFELKDPDGKPVRLSDLRGRVVLVNFWYPSCGPCRGEFPHLQRIVERFSDRGLTVLALNTHPKEADKVKSFLANNGYDFRALQTPTEEWSEETYGVRGTPANFLLDREGRVVAQPRLYNAETEQRLTLLIEALLERGS
ncbi:MAG: redoxin domain-containing protein [Thermoanaerobaculia bacterium]